MTSDDNVHGDDRAGHPVAGYHDTVTINRRRHDLSVLDAVWLFGYGSLIYKTGFPYRERCPATIRGWERRFWQGSEDHRGTPEHPGRVATLIRSDDATCAGMAYRVAPDVFHALDVREKNGYLRLSLPMQLQDGRKVDGLAYVASSDNAAWLGPATEQAIAHHIAVSRGPSGPNDEYLFKLADALHAMQADDPHVFAIEAALRAIENSHAI